MASASAYGKDFANGFHCPHTRKYLFLTGHKRLPDLLRHGSGTYETVTNIGIGLRSAFGCCLLEALAHAEGSILPAVLPEARG